MSYATTQLPPGRLVAVGGTLVAVGVTLVAVGGTDVVVDGAVVAVGGTDVTVGGTEVAVGGTLVAVAVGGTLVAVAVPVSSLQRVPFNTKSAGITTVPGCSPWKEKVSVPFAGIVPFHFEAGELMLTSLPVCV